MAALAAGAVGEIDRAFFDPADECLDVLVGEEFFDGIEFSRELSFGENGVNFRMAGAVENGDGAMCATSELRDEVVAAFELWWDLALAEWTDFHWMIRLKIGVGRSNGVSIKSMGQLKLSSGCWRFKG